MTTTVNNTVANNSTVFTVNNDMLNEKKAMKNIKKEVMIQAIEEIKAELVKLGAIEEGTYNIDNPNKQGLFNMYGELVAIYNQHTTVKPVEETPTVEEPVVTTVEEQPVVEEEEMVAPVEEEEVKPAKKEKKAGKDKKEPKEPKEKKERKCKTGTASERVEKYSKELEEKEAIAADEEKLGKLTSEERKALRHRIASLKRKIKRANYQLTIHGFIKAEEPVEEENVVVPDNNVVEDVEDIDNQEK